MSYSGLEVKDLSKDFDGVQALSNFSCSVGDGQLIGLIGPNGAGKTTFFNIITGFLSADEGIAKYRGENLLSIPPHKTAKSGVSRTFQILRLIRRMSVLENVLIGFQDQAGEKLRNLFFRPRFCRKMEQENRKKAITLLEEAGLVDKANDMADSLSYGQQKLLSLVCCLATGADLFLLDEPIAGIAPEMNEKILSMIRDLPKQGKSVIMIEHNLDAITRICDRVIFMDAGRKICEGTPEEVRNDPRVIEAYLN